MCFSSSQSTSFLGQNQGETNEKKLLYCVREKNVCQGFLLVYFFFFGDSVRVKMYLSRAARFSTFLLILDEKNVNSTKRTSKQRNKISFVVNK